MRLFEEIVEGSPDLIFIMELSSMAWVYVNKRAATVLGHSAAEILSMEGSLLPQLMEPHLVSQCVQDLKAHASLTPDQVRHQVIRLKDRLGESVRLEARLSPFSFDHFGEATHLLGVVSSIESFALAAVEAEVPAQAWP